MSDMDHLLTPAQKEAKKKQWDAIEKAQRKAGVSVRHESDITQAHSGDFNKLSMYLMAAYAYYVEDDPIMSDWHFDMLAKYLLENYDTIEHQHKHLVTKDDLRAGTYLGEYPLIVRGALNVYRRK